VPSPAGRVGAGILLSRISGFVRDAVLASYLGSRREADVWYLGLRLPNVIQNLLGEGTLSATLIPVYAAMVEDGRERDAGRFAGAALGLLAVLAFGIALVGILLAPYFIPLMYPLLDGGEQALLIRVVRILLPMTAVLAVGAWALGILNTHRRFFVAYTAPVAWNVAIIGVALGVGGGLGWVALGRQTDLVVALAWGALLGSFLQVGVMVPALIPLVRQLRPSLDTRVEGIRIAMRNFVPVAGARGVVNLSALVDSVLAALLVEGAVAHLARAQTLYILPISLFGIAVAAAELPELSRRRGRDAPEVLALRIRAALERVSFFLIPSAVAYLAFGDLIVEALFRRGAFGAEDARVVAFVLGGYALGLIASGSSRTLSSAFHALQDTRTPALFALFRVGLSIGLGAALMFPLDHVRVGGFGLGASGLALGSAAGAWLEYALLRRALRRAVGEHGAAPGFFARLLLCAACGAAVVVGVRALVESPLRALLPGWSEGLVLAAGTAALFGVTYLGGARIFRVGPPLRGLLRR
jgi:putative peptidoglycan lipid II flippase